jgi:hypothetical protein
MDCKCKCVGSIAVSIAVNVVRSVVTNIIAIIVVRVGVGVLYHIRCVRQTYPGGSSLLLSLLSVLRSMWAMGFYFLYYIVLLSVLCARQLRIILINHC